MGTRNTKRALGLIGLFASFLVICGRADAATNTSSGITVSPIIEQFALSQNQTSLSYPLKITNDGNAVELVSFSAENFTSLNGNGEISFTHKTNASNALAGNIRFNYSELAIAPHSSQTALVDLENINQLSVGGHYAAIILRVVNTTQQVKGNNVFIDQASSSLLFITTPGGTTQLLKLYTPVLGSFYVGLPQTIDTVFSNKGNTQTIPQGTIQIVNSSGEVVRQGQININSGLVLPGSNRLFNTNLLTVSQDLWPGKYLLRINYHYSGQLGYKSYSQYFLFINGELISGFILFLILIVAILVFCVHYVKRFIKRKSKTNPHQIKINIV